MSFFAITTDENGDVQVNSEELEHLLNKMIGQLTLLNARVEDAFNTGIELNDIDEEE